MSKSEGSDFLLEIPQKRRGAEAEEVGVNPLLSENVTGQSEPLQSIVGSSEAARRLEADLVTSEAVILADGSHHHEAYGHGCIHGFFAS